MIKKSAQSGAAVLPLLIIGAVIIGVVVLLAASGVLKFSGYVKVDKPASQIPAGTPTSTPVEAKKSPVALTAYQGTDYSISYPEGWTVQSVDKMVSITHKDPDGGLLIITNPIGALAGAKLATVADANKLVAQQQFKNANFQSEKETKLNGQDAWKYELTANNDGTDIKVVYYVLADSKNIYILMGTTTVENWKDLEGQLNTSFNTFKLSE